jgi:hypothetical protein
MSPLSQDELLAMLADELDAARGQIEALGVALVSDRLVAVRYITELQALDHVGQRCASIAAILRADDRIAAGHQAQLESIPARLKRAG